MLNCNRFILVSWHAKIQIHLCVIQNHCAINLGSSDRGMVEVIGMDEITKRNEKRILWKDHNSSMGEIRNSLLMQVCLEPDIPSPLWVFCLSQIINLASLTHSSQYQLHSFFSCSFLFLTGLYPVNPAEW